MQALPLYLLLGAAAGLLAGLLGVGGGLIIVPALIGIFTGQGFDNALVAHLAVGSSLASIVATSLSAIRAQHQRDAVRWGALRLLLPGILAGAGLGALVADALSTLWMKRIFALFVILVGVRMLRTAERPAGPGAMPGRAALTAAGTLIGGLSAIVGIGGGSMTVPFLSRCGVPMPQAVATASACGLPIAVAGGVAFALAGLGAPLLPAGSTGYLYWPAIFGIAPASVLCAPLGVRLSHHLPPAALKRIFALLLFFIGGRMAF